MTAKDLNLEVIILAGGKSSRMGVNKGLIRLNGKSMIDMITESLKSIASDFMIIANDDAYSSYSYTVKKDIIPDKGAASGVHSALAHAERDLVLIMACDTPFVSAELISFMHGHMTNHDIVIPVYKGMAEPLIGLYKKSVLKKFEAVLEKGFLKMTDIFDNLNTRYLEIPEDKFPEKTFFNVNSKEDLLKIFPNLSIS